MPDRPSATAPTTTRMPTRATGRHTILIAARVAAAVAESL